MCELFTPREVAGLLRINYRTVLRMIERGEKGFDGSKDQINPAKVTRVPAQYGRQAYRIQRSELVRLGALED